MKYFPHDKAELSSSKLDSSLYTRIWPSSHKYRVLLRLEKHAIAGGNQLLFWPIHRYTCPGSANLALQKSIIELTDSIYLSQKRLTRMGHNLI